MTNSTCKRLRPNFLLAWRVAVSLLFPMALVGSITASGGAQEAERQTRTLPESNASWHGFPLHAFQIDDKVQCKVVSPNQAASGKPWIWRARFFGHEPQTDIALLEKGFHVAYCDVANLFGSDSAIKRWDTFYAHVTESYGFSKRVTLEGMSRGGLIIFRWAAMNPEKVNCIYGDAPVCDFKSWPGGKGTGDGSPKAWKACLTAYGFKNEQEALAFDQNPIDLFEIFKQHKIPTLIVYGKDDVVVPPSENGLLLEQRCRTSQPFIQLVGKDGVGHHPHSLKDPQPIVDFVERHTHGSLPNQPTNR